MRLFLNGRQIAKVAPFFRTSQGWLLLHRQTTPKTSRLPASQQLAAFASSISAGNSRQPKLDEGSGEGPMEEKDGGNSAETEGKRLSAFLDKLCGVLFYFASLG
jgi:hypothetical protein